MARTVELNSYGLQTGMTDQSVRTNVLDGGLESKLRSFDSQFVHHHNADLALERLLENIRHAGPDTLVYVIAPGCTGTSTLKREAKKALCTKDTLDAGDDEAHLPLIDYELALSDGTTNWREVHHGALDAFREQLIDRGIPRSRILRAPRLPLNSQDSRMSSDRAYRSYLSCLKYWRPFVAFWDNADYLLRIPIRRSEWLLDPLIGMCSIAPHILTGTPTLMNLRNLSFKAGNRSECIYVRSYSLCDPIDQERFAIALRGFERVLPLADPPDLISKAEYLMTGTVGCVGLLKNWLRAALRRALIENTSTITIKHFEATRRSGGLLREAALEITEFEKALLEDESPGLSWAMEGLYAVSRERMEKTAAEDRSKARGKGNNRTRADRQRARSGIRN